MTSVALDVESVLADPNGRVLESTDRLTRDQIESEWFSDSEDDHAYQIYMGVSDAIWRHKHEIIPPEEPHIATHVQQIYAKADTLDIVTHRQHVDEQVKAWLDEHAIRYDNFISCDEPKQELGYDVYIDDNPNLFNECRLLLRDQPWNQHIDAWRSKSTDRIYSLDDVLGFF